MSSAPLKTVLGNHPLTTPIKEGKLAAPGLDLELMPVKPVSRAFKGMVREQAYDICEMAIVTYLQARAYNKPVWLLPVVLLARYQHRCIVCNTQYLKLAPAQLAGRRVGVRAYSQTTGAWVRGILAEDYGVDSKSIRWLTYEDAHVAEYADPAGVVRAPEGTTPAKMLLAGEIDAAVLGNDLPDDPRMATIVADPEGDAHVWYARHRVIPINHMVVVTEKLLTENLQAVRDFFGLLVKAKQQNGGRVEDGIDMSPIGVEAMRRSLQRIIDYCVQQELIPRRLEVDELFHDATRDLGA